VVAAVYLQQFGSLQVDLSPAGAVSAGAAWQVDGGPWEPDGVTLTNVPVAIHMVSFLPVSGWTTPSNQSVVINSNQTSRITGVYQEQGGLQVTISPRGAIVAGANGRWMAEPGWPVV
jgi:hypothetical protein